MKKKAAPDSFAPTFGQVMQFVREQFPSDPRRNGSILKNLWKRYGPHEVGVMVKGAALLGWKDLRGLWSKEGIGRRWAQTAYWNRVKKAPVRLEAVAALLKRKGF